MTPNRRVVFVSMFFLASNLLLQALPPIAQEASARAEASGIEQQVLSGLSRQGYARPESVNLRNCQLTVVVRYSRPCLAGFEGAITKIVDNVNLSELSDHVYGLVSTRNDMELITWSLTESVRTKIEKISQARGALFSEMGASPDDTMLQVVAASKLAAQMLKTLGVESVRNISLCSGNIAVEPYVRGVVLDVSVGKASEIAESLYSYTQKYCVRN